MGSVGSSVARGTCQIPGAAKSSRGDGFNAPGSLLPFPPAVVCVVLEYCLLGLMPFCNFQAGMGFLAVVSAVSWSLCWAEAVPPLAKRRRGCPQGLQKGCSEDGLSPRVLRLAGEGQRGYCEVLRPVSTLVFATGGSKRVADG